MNNKQREFLNALHELCERYNVSMITVLDEDYITLISNGNRMSFKTYADGQYSCVRFTEYYGDYIAEDDEEE